MVTDALIGWMSTAVAAVLGILPHPVLPAFVTAGPPSWFIDALAFASKLGGWFPLPAIAQSAGFLLLCWTAAIGIRIARIALSFIPLVGGTSG